MSDLAQIKVENIDHLGIVAGIIDEIGIVEIINQKLGVDKREEISKGQVVKAMILNGLGMVSKPLYLCSKFLEDKAIEKLLGKGVKSEDLNDDKLGRTLDKLYKYDVTNLFIEIVLSVIKQFKIEVNFSHLDSTSFHLHGEHKSKQVEKIKELEGKEIPILISKGYSRDNRPDLKQCILNLIVSNDGEIPIFMKAGDGNQSDQAILAKLLMEYKKQIKLETIMVCDSALYSQDHIQLMNDTPWITRVPLTIKKARNIIQKLDLTTDNESEKEEEEELIQKLKEKGYKWQEVRENYGAVEQRWLLVESEARKKSDWENLKQRIKKEKEKVLKIQKKLEREKWEHIKECNSELTRINKKLKYWSIEREKITEKVDKKKEEIKYQIKLSVKEKVEEIEIKKREAGKFIWATNVLEKDKLSSAEILKNYQEQQSSEKGFRFLKDPLFFADSFFVESPERIEAILWLMSICLLVYNLGQRAVRKQLKRVKKGIKNQVGKLTNNPTLRWIFQCFQGIHLVKLEGNTQVINLTPQRQMILRYLPPECYKYYE